MVIFEIKDTRTVVVDFEKAPQDHYGVFFPDLPGYVSMGNDLQHTHSMAKEALGLHLWGFERSVKGDGVVDTLFHAFKPVLLR